jgi:hypothetical protein
MIDCRQNELLCTIRIAIFFFISAHAIAAANPIAALTDTIRQEVDTKHGMETVTRVYSSDRWFTFPKFEETARYLKARLEQSGVKQVEIGGARADGKSQAGFWTMPMAWDAKAARLELIEPEHSLLCDYQAVPASLGMWSGSTPAGGITAEVVDIPRTRWLDVRGKLVLTDKNSSGYKFKLVKYGAVGAINGFSENPALPDGRQWINAWGDNGWGFIKTSTPLLSFSVTPRQAERLRQIMASGKKVMVHATADTRFYEGRYPWITGVLPGASSDEEVLVLGHTSEQGAQDNATGVAAMVESLATIGRLVEGGKLPRPQRGIRILLMPELYGSLSYISEHPQRMKQTVAAMTVDTPAASYDLAGTEYTFYMNPHVARSYTDALILQIAGTFFSSKRPWHISEHTTGTDSYLGEPAVGVPDVWVYSGTGIVTHHNSEDKPDTVDPRSLRDLIAVIATYLYFNAAAGEPQARWLAEIALDRNLEQIKSAAMDGVSGLLSNDSASGSYALARVSYFADCGEEAILSVLRLVPEKRRSEVRRSLDPVLSQVRGFRDLQIPRLRAAGAEQSEKPLTADDQIVVRRKRIGTIPLDDLPQDQWEWYPSGAWDKLVTVALYWCDGKRNLAQVRHLTEMEVGPTHFDFAGYFRFLEKHGYVEFAK